jgi:hypothetical protein
MKKRKMPVLTQPAADMLNQKTNEDFNNKKPSPEDPNEKKNTPITKVPVIKEKAAINTKKP